MSGVDGDTLGKGSKKVNAMLRNKVIKSGPLTQGWPIRGDEPGVEIASMCAASGINIAGSPPASLRI